MTATEAMQSWLALEHEAVWLYPVIGARFDGLADRARESDEAHRDVRDRLMAGLRALDVEPVAAKLSYDIKGMRSSQRAQRAARQLEGSIAAACLALAGDSTEDDGQTYAIKGLRRAARAELTWGGRPRAFPGLD